MHLHFTFVQAPVSAHPDAWETVLLLIANTNEEQQTSEGCVLWNYCMAWHKIVEIRIFFFEYLHSTFSRMHLSPGIIVVEI